MPHPFCGTELVCPPTIPKLGWNSWKDGTKAIYIKAVIDPSVTYGLECGAAIQRWNEAVGARFYMCDKGDVEIKFLERNTDEWPFNVIEWRPGGQIAAGFALNFDPAGNMLGTNPGRIARSEIYVNRQELAQTDFAARIYYFAHETGHTFGIDDHPNDDINSIMSYQRQGRALLGPSFEDTHGVAHIYGLHDLIVRPQDLEGFEYVTQIWYYDRYGVRQSHLTPWRRWRGYFSFLSGTIVSDLTALEPFERYYVYVKATGTPIMLGFGRFSQQVFPNQQNIWTYR